MCRAQHGEMFAVIINNPIFQVRKPRLRKEDVSLPKLNTEWAVPRQKLTSSVSIHCSADQLCLITKTPAIMSLIYIFCLVPQKVLSSTWQKMHIGHDFFKSEKLGSGEGKVMWRKGTRVTKTRSLIPLAWGGLQIWLWASQRPIQNKGKYLCTVLWNTWLLKCHSNVWGGSTIQLRITLVFHTVVS